MVEDSWGRIERLWNKEGLKMRQEVFTNLKGKHLNPRPLESLAPL